MSGLTESVMVAGAFVALVAALSVGVVGSRRNLPRSWSPFAREWAARALLWLPLWAPIAVIAAALAPSAIGALSGGADHCLTGAVGGHHHHHHLCVLHPPHASGSIVGWLLPLVAAAAGLVLSARGAWRARSRWALARTLVRLSRSSELGPNIRLVDRVEPVALTVGLRRPTVLISTGLMERATPETLDAVLAHERAHVARRDTLWGVADALAASIVPRRAARGLLAAISLAREQSCDERAARATNRIGVARALTEVLRLGMTSAPAGVSIADSSVQARVESLLRPAAPTDSPRRIFAGAAAVAILAILAIPSVHSAVEHLVTRILH